jgi:uncharacterized protein YoxC
MKNFNLEKISEKLIHWIGSTSSLIAHTFLFMAVFLLGLFGINWSKILLILTTAVSLEAIYLAVFIQISVNKTSQSLKSVETDIDEIQEDVDEIQEDVSEIQEDDQIEETEKNEQESALNEIKTELAGLMRSVGKLSELQQIEQRKINQGNNKNNN